MADSCGIPVIDFGSYRLSLDGPDSAGFQTLVDDVHHALTTIGFFYIVNADFPFEKVRDMYKKSKEYFDLPLDVKAKHSRDISKGSHGYVRMEEESTDPERDHGDLKETFNINPTSAGDAWPTESECPGFKTTMMDFFQACLPIHNRVLEVMARGLKLEDPMFFAKHHANVWTDCAMTLRTLFYPPLSGLAVKERQVRCGEHSDYGSITLLFQQTAGLQVRERDGGYVKVPMVDDAILINTGNLMERWTADVYPATRHCVFLDDTPEERSRSRQSVVFFGFPDNHALIECVDKSGKYPPITALDYLNYRFQEAFRQT